MKVGIIVPGFSASEHDWCIPALLDLVRGLSRAPNVDIHVFPLRYPHVRRRYNVYGATVQPQGGATVRGASRVPLVTRSVRAILDDHRRSAFDVLHAYWADEPGLVATTAAGLLRIPVIVSLAGGELVDEVDISYGAPRRSMNRLMTRFALRRASQVTAGSRYLMNIAAQRMDPSRLLPLPFGVDIQRFNPGNDENTSPQDNQRRFADSINVVHVASLVPVKEQSILLAAVAESIRDVPAILLHVAGDGPLLPALHEQVARLEIAGHVQFHGAMAHDTLPALYRSADFCVQSSRYEAQGMVVLEAGACGRATVGTNVGILPEINPDGTSSVGDAHGLARQIVTLSRDPDLRSKHGRAAMRRVRQDHTLGKSIDTLLDLYRSVVVQNRLSKRGAARTKLVKQRNDGDDEPGDARQQLGGDESKSSH